MRPDIEIYAGNLEGGLKRLRRIGIETGRDARKFRWFISKGQKRRLARKKGVQRWRKTDRAIQQRLRRAD